MIINLNNSGSLNKILAIISCCFIAAILSANAQQNTAMEKQITSGYAPVNGLNLYYEIHGNGNIPLVLIHGGGSTIETSFGNFIPLMEGYGKIIAVELQAHGHTHDRETPESFTQDADDVAALLNHLKVDKANFLGFSNGGTTTLQIAIRHPDIVNKIVVVSANYRRDGMLPGFFDGMQNATLAQMPALLQDAFLKVTPDLNRLKRMFEQDKARMIGFKDIADEDIKAIKARALIMVGDQDVVTTEHAIKISHLITGARLAVLPGTHGSFIGEVCSATTGSKIPGLTATLVEEFLSE